MNDTDNTDDTSYVHYELSTAKQLMIAAGVLGLGGGFFSLQLNNVDVLGPITAGLGLLISLVAIPYTLTRSPLDGAADAEQRSFKSAKRNYLIAIAIIALCAAYRLVTAR